MAEMSAEAAAALRKPFPRSAIGKLPKGGMQLDYVGHAATTDRLLAVDPAWTWEPMATTPEGLPMPDGSGNLWIRLTVCGVTRIGVGDGKSIKECIGDAIRNAAMRFGVALDLWSKEELEQVGTDQAAKTTAPEPRDEPEPQAEPDDEPQANNRPAPASSASVQKLVMAFNKLEITDRAERLWTCAQLIGRDSLESANHLTQREVSTLIDTLEACDNRTDLENVLAATAEHNDREDAANA